MKETNSRLEEESQLGGNSAVVRTETESEAISRVRDSLDLAPEEVAAWQRTIADWRKFCLEMAEFFLNLCTPGALDRREANLLQPLIEIFVNAAATFSSQDPLRAPEQCREWELCLNCSAVFFAIEDETGEALQDMCRPVYGLKRSKWRAVAEALIANQLRGWRDWKQARGPIRWVHETSDNIHRGHCPLSMEEEPDISSLDATTATGDPYAALLPDLSGDQLISEIHARVDLVTACERAGLAPETSQLALGRYNCIPLSLASKALGLSKRDLAAASREFTTAKPALQAWLAPYRPEKVKSQVKQI
jgi:hypothetical protein